MAELPEIPGYRLKKILGRGGMATVFLGEPDAGGDRVAIKVMHPASGTDPEWAARFLREAAILTRLQHPNIVRVLASGENKGYYYMVMEHLDQGDLTTWLKQGLQPREGLPIVRALALALEYAHALGYVHRDVKPDNVLFRAGGVPVLTDFGVARQRATDTHLTQFGMTVGTPRYMSPEQHRGMDVDKRSDLYSLGIVLYELLTRSVPFDGPDSMSIGIQHLQQPVPRLPLALSRYQRLIDATLAKLPNERISSGKTLAQMIDNSLSIPNENVKQNLLLGEARERGLVIREKETKTGFMKKACDIAVAVYAEDYEMLKKHWSTATQELLEWRENAGNNARQAAIDLFVHPWILARAQDLARQLAASPDFDFLGKLGTHIRIHNLDAQIEHDIDLSPPAS